jgi:hypothetical protein
MERAPGAEKNSGMLLVYSWRSHKEMHQILFLKLRMGQRGLV